MHPGPAGEGQPPGGTSGAATLGSPLDSLLPRLSEAKTGRESSFWRSEALRGLRTASAASRQARREQETELVLSEKRKAAGRAGQGRLEPSPPLRQALLQHGCSPSTFAHSAIWQTWLVWKRLPVKAALSPPQPVTAAGPAWRGSAWSAASRAEKGSG